MLKTAVKYSRQGEMNKLLIWKKAGGNGRDSEKIITMKRNKEGLL